MTFSKKSDTDDFLHPLTQPEVLSEKLFDLICSAHRQGRMHVIMDHCENDYGHRNLKRLDKDQQDKLHEAARDELSVLNMTHGWNIRMTPTDTLQ